MAAVKCVHKGCGKVFTDADEPCIYHPGPPVFHEGQKGWKCCKPRVLTFDEFMTIPPCTTGTHSAVDDSPKPEPKPSDAEVEAKIKAQQATTNEQNNTTASTTQPAVSRAPIAAAAAAPQATPAAAAPEPQEEEDDPQAPVPDGARCKRKACGGTYTNDGQSRDAAAEQCVHHPGHALFHEGSKGWTCCKRRVLEFDEFMRIPGCTTKPRHLFLGGRKKDEAPTEEETLLTEIRSDFYQTATTVIASLYLKKIDAGRSSIAFADDGKRVALDLVTADKKRYRADMSLFGVVVPERCAFKILGTKLELTLAKADGAGWPVLRADDRHTGEIIQAGRAGRV